MTNLTEPLTHIATWQARGYSVRLFRAPIRVGEAREYNLIAIDSGNVRRVDLDLVRRDGLDLTVGPDHAWLLEGAPANARRILRRFASA